MLLAGAAVVVLLLAGALFALLAGSSTAGAAIAFALFGIACVVAMSLVFLAIGRSEDAERAGAAQPPEPQPEPPSPPPPPPPPLADRPAVQQRRPLPPRRPS